MCVCVRWRLPALRLSHRLFGRQRGSECVGTVKKKKKEKKNSQRKASARRRGSSRARAPSLRCSSRLGSALLTRRADGVGSNYRRRVGRSNAGLREGGRKGSSSTKTGTRQGRRAEGNAERRVAGDRKGC